MWRQGRKDPGDLFIYRVLVTQSLRSRAGSKTSGEWLPGRMVEDNLYKIDGSETPLKIKDSSALYNNNTYYYIVVYK